MGRKGGRFAKTVARSAEYPTNILPFVLVLGCHTPSITVNRDMM